MRISFERTIVIFQKSTNQVFSRQRPTKHYSFIFLLVTGEKEIFLSKIFTFTFCLKLFFSCKQIDSFSKKKNNIFIIQLCCFFIAIWFPQGFRIKRQRFVFYGVDSQVSKEIRQWQINLCMLPMIIHKLPHLKITVSG